jgi:hypothetical protein
MTTPRSTTQPNLDRDPPQPQPEPLKPLLMTPPSQPPSPIPSIPSNKTSGNSKEIVLEPLCAPPPSSEDQREFWALFPKLFPELKLYQSIPSDDVAQKLKNGWLQNLLIPPIIIIASQLKEQELAFLKNVAKAISLKLAPAQVFSSNKLKNNWENVLKSTSLRLVIASKHELNLQPDLKQFYSENPQQSKHFLKQIPLLLLSDLSLYLKKPELKSHLWQTICSEFAASQPPSTY